MKNLLLILLLFSATKYYAQETADRFFYELSYKPKKDSAKIEKEMMILDITKSKSIYRDYTVVYEDSINIAGFEVVKKFGGNMNFGSIKDPKFTYKIIKPYPITKVIYQDNMINNFKPTPFAYEEEVAIKWNISNEKQKIGEYNTQKANAFFGGRNWEAWFSTDIPFQDGPYKFSGLPGLIVKVEDDQKNYSWVLVGNKKISNYEELTYSEKMIPHQATVLSKEKFEKAFKNYRENPYTNSKNMLSTEDMNKKIMGDKTLAEILKEQEQKVINYYKANNNPIEIE